jgi:hypothetical protein
VNRKAILISAAAIMAIAVIVVLTQSDRHAEVAGKGRQVMPFDLDRTTHKFTPLENGGRQTVTADDPGDTVQIGLIRDHLEHEQTAFARGDFSDPATIHGDGMPGLAALREGGGRITVIYTPLSSGAELTYTTSEPSLIAAIHAWFAAQTSDHGSHAS